MDTLSNKKNINIPILSRTLTNVTILTISGLFYADYLLIILKQDKKILGSHAS